jgi:hypothetical protein
LAGRKVVQWVPVKVAPLAGDWAGLMGANLAAKKVALKVASTADWTVRSLVVNSVDLKGELRVAQTVALSAAVKAVMMVARKVDYLVVM